MTSAPRRAGALLAVCNLLFFWPVLFHGRVFSSHDVALSLHPWKASSGIDLPRNRLLADPATSSESLLRSFRKLPEGFFWNRSIGGGAPGPVNLVQGNLSPFFWLPALALPEAGIETGILFLKLNASFLFALLFFRRRKFSDNAASAGAAVWALSSVQTYWWLWMQTSVSVFFPLLLWSVDVALESPAFVPAAAAAAWVFLGLFAGGYPFWIFFGAILVAFAFLSRIGEFPSRAMLAAAARLSCAAAIALAILLPAGLVSFRFLKETGEIQRRAGLGAQNPMPLRQLRLYLAPGYAGNAPDESYTGVGMGPMDNPFETASAVGPFALGFAALAAASRRRRRLVLLAAALALSVGIPLYAGGRILRAVGSLPGFSAGHFHRTKVLIVLAIAIACAAGVEVLEELFRGRTVLRRILSAVPYAIAVPLVLLAARNYPAVPPSRAVFSATPGIEKLLESESAAPARFLGTGWTLMPNLSEAFGVEDVRSHLMHEQAYVDLLRSADPNVYGTFGTLLIFGPRSFDPSSPVLDLLNVTRIATPPGVRRPDSREAGLQDPVYLFSEQTSRVSSVGERSRAPLPLAYSGPDMALFSRPGAFARFFPVSRVREGGAPEAAAASREELATTAFVPGRDFAPLRNALSASRPEDTRVRIVEYRAEKFALSVDAKTPVFFASSEKLFDPYWRGFLDDRPAPVTRSDGLFFGMLVPAGKHLVEGEFQIPRREIALSAIGAVALLFLTLAAGILSRSRRRTRGTPLGSSALSPEA